MYFELDAQSFCGNMKINIVAVGKVKEKYFAEGIAEYVKRMGRYASVSVKETEEEYLPDKVNRAIIDNALKKEGERIMPALKGYIVALCIEGKKIGSEELAEVIERAKTSFGEITFVIGSSYGLCESVKEAANYKLSLSDMTFPHTMARLILTEQLYRALNIISGGKYHK